MITTSLALSIVEEESSVTLGALSVHLALQTARHTGASVTREHVRIARDRIHEISLVAGCAVGWELVTTYTGCFTRLAFCAGLCWEESQITLESFPLCVVRLAIGYHDLLLR